MNLREQQKQKTRLQLMNTAMSLFAELGYEQVTLAQIAERADIHVQTLYKHFKTKVSLATAYFDLYLDLAIENLEQLESEQDVFVEVSKATIVILETIVSTDSVLSMFQMIHANEELLASTQHRLRLFEDRLAITFEKKNHSKFNEIEARMLAALMVSAYRDSHFAWIRSEGKVDSAKKYKVYLTNIKAKFTENLL